MRRALGRRAHRHGVEERLREAVDGRQPARRQRGLAAFVAEQRVGLAEGAQRDVVAREEEQRGDAAQRVAQRGELHEHDAVEAAAEVRRVRELARPLAPHDRRRGWRDPAPVQQWRW